MILALTPAAFLAGVLMFLAPCTLPIVPGYLAFIAGGRGRVLRNAVAFVIGFSIVFILLGTFASFLGALLGPWRGILGRGAGLLIIFFGLTMLHVIDIPFITRERRARIPQFLVIGRPESSLLIGALFALGWSPCIGPLLGTVLLLASQTPTALQGAILLAVFSAGLGLPFLLAAVFIAKLDGQMHRFDHGILLLEKVGGVVLIAVGLLILFGEMSLLVNGAYRLFNFWGYDRLINYL